MKNVRYVRVDIVFVWMSRVSREAKSNFRRERIRFDIFSTCVRACVCI